MSESDRKSGFASKFSRIFNGGTQGRVSGATGSQQHHERVEDLLDAMDPAREIKQASDDRTDRWSGTRDLSIEEQRQRTLDIQSGLDDQVEAENRGESPVTKGLPPCKRVNKEG